MATIINRNTRAVIDNFTAKTGVCRVEVLGLRRLEERVAQLEKIIEQLLNK